MDQLDQGAGVNHDLDPYSGAFRLYDATISALNLASTYRACAASFQAQGIHGIDA